MTGLFVFWNERIVGRLTDTRSGLSGLIAPVPLSSLPTIGHLPLTTTIPFR